MPVPKSKGPSLGVGQPGLQTPAPPPPAPHQPAGAYLGTELPRPRGEGPAATQTRRVCQVEDRGAVPSGHSDSSRVSSGTARSVRWGGQGRSIWNPVTPAATLGGRGGAGTCTGGLRWPWGWHGRGSLGAPSTAHEKAPWIEVTAEQGCHHGATQGLSREPGSVPLTWAEVWRPAWARRGVLCRPDLPEDNCQSGCRGPQLS